MILFQSFYRQGTITVARRLLGCYLVHVEGKERTIGRIVETEAYPLTDPASHGFKGETQSNHVLFGSVGHAYVYRAYGLHCCFNVVTGGVRTRGAVLVRALEPIQGIALMQKRRGTRQLTDLASGPGKLAQALGITLAYNGMPLADGPLQIWGPDSFPSHGDLSGEDIVQTTRIGLTKAADRPLRFYLKGNGYVSRK